MDIHGNTFSVLLKIVKKTRLLFQQEPNARSKSLFSQKLYLTYLVPNNV